MKRNILSVLAGLVAAIVIFLIAESLAAYLYPYPSGLNFQDKVAMKAFNQQQPLVAWLLVLLGWTLGSFFCGYLIKWISRSNNKTLPLIAGIVLTLSAVSNFYMIPHPTWFVVAGLLVFIPITFLGHRLKKGKKFNYIKILDNFWVDYFF